MKCGMQKEEFNLRKKKKLKYSRLLNNRENAIKYCYTFLQCKLLYCLTRKLKNCNLVSIGCLKKYITAVFVVHTSDIMHIRERTYIKKIA